MSAKKRPRCMAENQSLQFVAATFLEKEQQYIETPVASQLMKDIFLERLDKEILKKYQHSLSISTRGRRDGKSRRCSRDDDEKDKKEFPTPCDIENEELATEHTSSTSRKFLATRALIKKRLLAGTNECTRALEAAIFQGEEAYKPSLIVLTKDLYPPNILAHVPQMAKSLGGIPILLLPKNASIDLGRRLGTKRVAILMFLPRIMTRNDALAKETAHQDTTQVLGDEEKGTINAAIDSFVGFVKSKLNENISNAETIVGKKSSPKK